MARYSVTHSCGHEVDYQLYGPGKDRQAKIAWMEGRLCEECWRAQELAKSQKVAKENGLPPLTGTKAQIAWAERIRAQIWEQITKISNPPEEITQWIEWLFAHSESAWWIETRQGPSQLEGMTLMEQVRFVLFGLTTEWRPFWRAWQRRIQQDAEDETKRERLRWETMVLDTLGAEYLSVWTSDRDPEDRRIYVNDHLIYDKHGPRKDASEEQVALMKELCRKWRSLKLRRRR